MGTYDIFEGAQIKVGNCEMRYYRIGDKVENDIPDGIILAYEGAVVIKDRVFVALVPLEKIFDKWGNQIDAKFIVNEANPITKVVESLHARSSQSPSGGRT